MLKPRRWRHAQPQRSKGSQPPPSCRASAPGQPEAAPAFLPAWRWCAAAAWCGGVLLRQQLDPSTPTPRYLESGAVLPWQLAAVALLLAAAIARRHRRAGLAALLLAALVPVGFGAADVSERPPPLLRLADQPAGLEGPWRVRGTLLREPERGREGLGLLLEVTGVRLHGAGGSWRHWHGRVEVAVGASSGTGPPSAELAPGAGVETFLSLRRDRPPANPGISRRDRLRPRGIDLRASLKSLGQLRLRSPAPWWGRHLAGLRGGVRSAIERRFAPGHRPLVAALLLGERAGIPDSVAVHMAGAGLAHVLSISGLHVGLLTLTAIGAARALGASPRRAAAAGLAAATLLALVVAPRPPVQRAAIMAAAVLGGRVLDRRTTAAEALATAGALLVWWRPATLADGGFQLSVVATAGLIALTPRRPTARGRRIGARIGAALLAPAAAQAAIAPLLALRSFAVPLPGLLLNPIAVPLLGLVLPVILAAVTLDLAGLGPLASAAATAGAAGLDALVALASDGYPRRAAAVPAATVALALLWWSGLGWLAWGRRMRPLGLLPLVLATHLATRAPRPDAPQLVVLDVGQGDALLLQSPRGAVLVDGGGYAGVDWDIGAHLLVPSLRSLGVRRLEAVALTHPHADHAGGLPAVLEALPTRALWLGSVPVNDRRVHDLLATAASTGAAALSPAAELEAAGCRWRPLLPPPALLARGARRVDNEASLVLRVFCVDRELLLTGDAGTEAEGGWPLAGLRGAVLKVGHHGSRTATAASTVAAIRPRIALVSVGARNPFGLPREGVLERLRRSGAAIYRSDRDGALTVTLTGRRTVRGERWATGSGSKP